MRLFTSSSELRNIGKILIYTLLIGCLYYGVVANLSKNLHGANQSQTNILKAQDFVFDNNPYTHVLVGSSEAYNVPVNELSKNWANLGFAGGCSLTGLEVILRSDKKPDVVVVEVNETCLRGIDNDLLDEVKYWHKFPIGRQNTRIDYLAYLLKDNIKKAIGSKNIVKMDDCNFPRVDALEREQESMNKDLDINKMRDNLYELKKRIDILKHSGTRVIITEIPNDPSLYNSKQLQYTRNMAKELFPLNEYERFEVDWQEYKTRDGIHLSNLSAMKYAEIIVRQF